MPQATKIKHLLALAAVFVLATASELGCSSGDGDADADIGDAMIDGALDAEADAERDRPLGMIGASCFSDDDCVVTSATGQVACLRQAWGFREGYCTVVGLANESECLAADAESTHVALPCSQPICMLQCETAADCRPGYECFPGTQACWPRCEPDRACPIPPPTLCQTDEDCDDQDPCTADGCIRGDRTVGAGICAHERRSYDPRRVARIATLGPATDLIFSGTIAGNDLRLAVAEAEAGVEVFNLTIPTEPRLSSRLDTIGSARALLRQSGVVFVAEGDEGMELFDANSGGLLNQILVEEGEGEVYGLSRLGDNSISVFSYRHGIYRYNIENGRLNPTPCDTRGRAVDGVYQSAVSLIADSLAGLAVCSWAEGTTFATQVDRVDTAGRMLALSRQREVLATAEAGAGFGIFDVSNFANPERRYESGMLDDDVLDVLLAGTRTLAVAASSAGLYAFELEDCFEPVLWFRWDTDGPAQALAYTEGVLAIAMGDDGVDMIDLGCRDSLED